jgi:hypothetical protein
MSNIASVEWSFVSSGIGEREEKHGGKERCLKNDKCSTAVKMEMFIKCFMSRELFLGYPFFI